MPFKKLKPPMVSTKSIVTVRSVVLGFIVGIAMFQWYLLAARKGSSLDDSCAGSTSCVTVDLHKTHDMSPVMYGAFFEEINHAGEGGLHVEMMRDWSFEAFTYLVNHPELGLDEANHMEPKPVADYVPMPYRRRSALQSLSMDPQTVASAKTKDREAWMVAPDDVKVSIRRVEYTDAVTSGGQGASGASSTRGASALKTAFTASADNTAAPLPRLHALCVEPGADTIARVVNSGHTLEGFTIRPGEDYHLRLRVMGGSGSLEAAISSPAGEKEYASVLLTNPSTSSWHTLTGNLNSGEGGKNLRLVIKTQGPEKLCIDWVSLTHNTAWRGGKLNPFHPGLVDKLMELAPQHLRFPGGAFVEGTTMESAYRWQLAVGPRELRPGHPGTNWGYWSSGGLGLHEFFELAREIGSEPVWVLNLGISQSESVEPSGIAPWVQDGLDSLEYILGGPGTRWGAVRAAQGRAQPWTLNWLTLGNEDCMRPWYVHHYRLFSAAVRKRYPHLKFIANCDISDAPGTQGDNTEFGLWEFHSYRSPVDTWALRDAVEAFEGPPVGVTEFAAMSVEVPVAAVAEAGLMAAMERNCHKVRMVAYAPLLGHELLRTWRPNLIVFNEEGEVLGTPSFSVQSAFRRYAGVVCAKVKLDVEAGVEASATCQTADCSTAHIKLVNFNSDQRPLTLRIRRGAGGGRLGIMNMERLPYSRTVPISVMHVENPESTTHVFGSKPAFVPQESTAIIQDNGNTHLSLPPYSVTIVHLTHRKS